MAITSSFSFTNTTPNGDHKITPTALAVVTNYAIDSNTGEKCTLTNKTCAIDRPEIVTYQSRKIKNVNTSIVPAAPPKVRAGVQYGVQMETVLTSEDASIGYRVDDPIVVTISVRHVVSGHITDAHIKDAVERTLSYLYKNDGSSRLGDLVRGGEQPIAD